jgi:hypothetical protein
MTDDEWLAALARAARAQRAEAAPWERLASGELVGTEADTLRADALATPEGARKLAAFSPLGADVEARIAERLAGPAATAPSPARRRSRARWVPFVAGGALAAAAAVALAVRTRPETELPAYAVSLVTAARDVRGVAPEADDVVDLHPETRFELVARPVRPTAVPVAGRAAIVHAGSARVWSVPVEASAEGAVRVAGNAGALFPGPGEYDVVLAIAPAAALPDDAHLLSMAEGARAPGDVRVVRAHVRFTSR